MGCFTDGWYTGLDCIGIGVEATLSPLLSRFEYEESITLGARRADRHCERYEDGLSSFDRAKYIAGLSAGFCTFAVFAPYSMIGTGIYDIGKAAKIALKGRKKADR